MGSVLGTPPPGSKQCAHKTVGQVIDWNIRQKLNFLSMMKEKLLDFAMAVLKMVQRIFVPAKINGCLTPFL
jgi:hypothetical protein